MPLKLGNGLMAITRDISPEGMYFTIEGEHELQGALVFDMEMPGTRIKLTAEAQVVRVEHLAGSTGVAVTFHALKLEPMGPATGTPPPSA